MGLAKAMIRSHLGPMRALVLLLVLCAASPAVAQDYRAVMEGREAQLTADAEAARRREVELSNRLTVLEFQMSTEQAMRDLQAMIQRPAMSPPPPNAPPPIIDTSRLASIPDAALADSNARVRAAAANRK